MNIRPFTEEELSIGSCVYRLYVGNRFVIVKGKTFAGSMFLIQKGYAYFIAGGGGTGNKSAGAGQAEWEGKNTYYMKLYKYIRENPTLPIRWEILEETDSHYKLLVREQLEIETNMSNKKCLNNNVEAYIPIYRKKTKSYGWLNTGSVLAFKKLLKHK